MASLRPPGTSKHWIGRGRRKDGTQFEFSTEILVEPEGVAPENLPQKRAENKKRAKEVADDIEARERGSVKEEEFEARMKHRVRKVLQRNSNVPPAVFLVAWTWEHAIRNRLCPRRVSTICSLIGALLAHFGEIARRTVPKTMVFYDFTGQKSRSLARPGRPNSVADLVRTSQPV